MSLVTLGTGCSYKSTTTQPSPINGQSLPSPNRYIRPANPLVGAPRLAGSGRATTSGFQAATTSVGPTGGGLKPGTTKEPVLIQPVNHKANGKRKKENANLFGAGANE